MLRIKPSNTKQSSIIAMGKRLSDAMKNSGEEYLLLNRGVNSVVPIDLNPVIESIDFNSPSIQVYPGSNGTVKLRNAINEVCFHKHAETKNILVTGGGISGLDICFQNLELDKIFLPNYFWGTYAQILNLRAIAYDSYPSYEWLYENRKQLSGQAVIICDPGNPLGEKYDDATLINLISELDKSGVIVLFDSPYRKLFFDDSDTLYVELLKFEHVIIIESFSKSLGISGQRIGFIHSSNNAFIKEASNRISYATNGINGFAQALVYQLLSSDKGKQAVDYFKNETCKHIQLNIEYLQNKGLLCEELYKNKKPMGIFAAINYSQEDLFKHRIGSVGLDYFTLRPSDRDKEISRILVSIPHEKFVYYFRTLID